MFSLRLEPIATNVLLLWLKNALFNGLLPSVGKYYPSVRSVPAISIIGVPPILRGPSSAVPQRAAPSSAGPPDLIRTPLLPLHFSMPPLSSHSPSPATAPMAKPRAPGAITCSASCSTPTAAHGAALPSFEAPAPVTSAQDHHSPPQMI
jgi:hypothetical protein